MTTNIQAHNVAGLLTDLAAAKTNFEDVGNRMEAARRYLQDQRSRLNEQQFAQRTRELGGDLSRQAELNALTAHQRSLRCRYMTGKLAVVSRFNQLRRCKDTFVSQIVAAGAALAHVQDPSDQQALLSNCFWADSRLTDSFKTACYVMDNELGKDLTDGLAKESLIRLYGTLCRKGPSALETKKKDPTNCENHCWFIPLSQVEQADGCFAAIELNDELVVIGEAFNALADHNSYVESWNGFSGVQFNLNEPQYVQRLQQAAGDSERIRLIEAERQGRRAAYLIQRVSLDGLHRRLQDMKVQALALGSRLKGEIGAEVSDQQIGIGHQIAMSNVINASAMANWIDHRQEQWNKTLAETAATAASCQSGLSVDIAQKLAREPYSCYVA